MSTGMLNDKGDLKIWKIVKWKGVYETSNTKNKSSNMKLHFFMKRHEIPRRFGI